MHTEEFRTLLKQELTIAAGALGTGMNARCEQLSIGLDRCSQDLLAAAKETFVSNAFDTADMRRIIATALHGAKRADGFLTALDQAMREQSDLRQNKTTDIPLVI